MLMFDIPFGTTDWTGVERTEHAGENGDASASRHDAHDAGHRRQTAKSVDDRSPTKLSLIRRSPMRHRIECIVAASRGQRNEQGTARSCETEDRAGQDVVGDEHGRGLACATERSAC